ncbi:uncharacterized protein LOC109078864 [Cyprinus carpio]|uniref:Uncharacterized protein LOC109078864 n=1 Tax=Cyprinus carpio TaxID=7962 RepID=A0A9Q9Z659_CYPCA|nr:uncharacterized protein LOC109078864 [Cyprinus carpio]
MAAFTGRRRRGSEGRRKAKKKKHSSSKNKSEKSLRTQLTFYLHWCLFFFLLLDLPGASSLTVTGQKGGNITLPCNSSNREDLYMVLTFGSKTAYGTGQSKYYEHRVHKSGNCNLILQDLKTTDAGKYNFKVYASGQLLGSYIFDICVNVHVTARVGEEVMFDDLPRDAESVECLTNTSSIDVWRREQGVLTDRLTDSDGHLIIKNFRSSDAGTYRVLDSTGGVLVTVTLTEWGTESKDKQDSTRDDKTESTKRVYVCIAVLVLLALIAFTLFMIHRCLNRNKAQEVPMQETAQGPGSPNNSSGHLVVCFQCQQICGGSCQHIIPDCIS